MLREQVRSGIEFDETSRDPEASVRSQVGLATNGDIPAGGPASGSDVQTGAITRSFTRAFEDEDSAVTELFEDEDGPSALACDSGGIPMIERDPCAVDGMCTETALSEPLPNAQAEKNDAAGEVEKGEIRVLLDGQRD